MTQKQITAQKRDGVRPFDVVQCVYCNEEVQVGADGLIQYHEDILPLRSCEGSHRKPYDVGTRKQSLTTEDADHA